MGKASSIEVIMDVYSCLFPHAHMNHEISDISKNTDNHTITPEIVSWEGHGSSSWGILKQVLGSFLPRMTILVTFHLPTSGKLWRGVA